MSFQYIIDNASTINFDRSPVVAQTLSRDGTIRATSRGGSNWKFTVSFGNASWTDLRTQLESIESKGRHTSDNINFNSSGHSWMFPYKGAIADRTGWTTATLTAGNTFTILGFGSATVNTGNVILKAGDLVQLGSTGHVYTVVNDVTKASGVNPVVTVHRPLIESGGGVTLVVGPACNFKVFCTKIPQATMFDYNLANFNGPFEFIEDMT